VPTRHAGRPVRGGAQQKKKQRHGGQRPRRHLQPGEVHLKSPSRIRSRDATRPIVTHRYRTATRSRLDESSGVRVAPGPARAGRPFMVMMSSGPACVRYVRVWLQLLDHDSTRPAAAVREILRIGGRRTPLWENSEKVCAAMSHWCLCALRPLYVGLRFAFLVPVIARGTNWNSESKG
jgi:hypothetical protein